jgi:hypothetical protein
MPRDFPLRAFGCLTLLGGLLLAGAAAIHAAEPSTLVCVSVTPEGYPGNQGSSEDPWISSDGKIVQFGSNANNLGPTPPTTNTAVYFRDLTTGITQILRAPAGQEPFGIASLYHGMSRNGRFLCFLAHTHPLLGLPNPQHRPALILYDRLTGTQELINRTLSGGVPASSTYMGIASDDGRYVVFSSAANDLVAGDTNGVPDLFLRDRQTGRTSMITRGWNGAPSNGTLYWTSFAVSKDARFVAFTSLANNLIPNDKNGNFDVFVADLLNGTMERASVNRAGQGEAASHGLSISSNGRFVSFHSNRPLTTGGGRGIHLFDRVTRLHRWVAQATLPAPISGDGRFMAFATREALVAEDTNRNEDVYVMDLETEAFEWVSYAPNGSINREPARVGNSHALSEDGRSVVFLSWASNLTRGDNNDRNDVFVRNREPVLGAGVTATATVLNASSIRLAWTDTSRFERGWRIWRSTNGNQYVTLLITSPNVTSWTDTGLLPKTVYRYRVQAVGATELGPFSIPVNATTPSAPPSAPTGLQARALRNQRVKLSWQYQQRSGQQAEGLRLYRKRSGGSFGAVVTLPSTSRNFRDSGLTAGKRYSYQVVAFNDGGESSPSNMARAKARK